MRRYVVTGATGFIGKTLVRRLRERGDSVSVIGRDAVRIRQIFPDAAVVPLAWGETNGWKPAVQGADAVIHLAGESINGQRWTPEYKQKILNSRVETTRAVTDAQPKVLVSASAVGYYGDRKNETITETDRRGSDFLADVCVAWESEAARARTTGNSRVSILRIGIVLGREGGPLQSMLQPPGAPFSPFKLGLGGPIGSGKQWVPWVHVEDLVSMLVFAADNTDAPDVMNGVAPEPVTNAQLTAAIGRILNRPAVLPVPSFVVRALLGEFAYAVLYSQRVLPVAAQVAGFVWRFPDIESALQDLLAAK